MMHRKRVIFTLGILIILGLLLALGVFNALQRRQVVHHFTPSAPPVPMPGKLIADSLACDLYDCTMTLAAAPAGQVRVMLEGGRGKNYSLVEISAGSIRLASVRNGAESTVARVKAAITGPYHLSILRRGELLGLLHDGTLLYVGRVPHAQGNGASIEVAPGWTVSDIDAHALEPVGFADDFMRTANEPGAWESARGQWRLQSSWDDDPHGNTLDPFHYTIYAQNPFAWVGKPAGDAALCITGKATWEDYTLTAAVHPGTRGAIGLAVDLADAHNGYLLRWSAASDHGARGNSLTLLKLADGKTTTLATAPGGYVPGQWYQLAMTTSLEGIRVSIDGQERLFTPKCTPWHGKVGLYAEGDPATFDDVTVYGSTLKKHLLAENAQETIKQGFLQDRVGMQLWANAANDWTTGFSGTTVQKHEFYGDHWMTLKVTPYGGSGALTMALNSDGMSVQSGEYATISVDTASHLTISLSRDGRELATATGSTLTSGEEYTFRLQRAGKRLTLQCDGETVVEAEDSKPVSGHFPAYAGSGSLSNTRDACVLGANFLDYTFTGAPVDWRGEGTWAATMRWACKPQWSFYSGWSRGDAVLWHKRRFIGDQSLQAFTAFKMEYPRETNFYDQKIRYHDANLTICGDGQNPRSGYTICSGLPDRAGNPNARTVLLRNGVQVAESPISIMGWGYNHGFWYNMELRKHGDTVQFLLAVNGKVEPVITYHDRHPIDGGVPAIWTTDNGLSIARARIHFEKSELTHDPRVYLDTPWFPEWADMGRPLALDFPNAFSTTGRSVLLQVQQKLAPGPEPLPAVHGTSVTFTPRHCGDYWYQLTGTDGTNTSPAFHLFLPTYNPALGRDDAHAVLLYHFNEHAGNTVHDHSRIGAPADLHIPAESSTCWLPGQGLTFHGRKPLTADAGGKLMALKRQHAATIELWASNASSYPPDHWMGVILSWEKAAERRNFQVGIHMNTFILVPPSGVFNHGPTVDNFPDLTGSFNTYGIRTGLQHLVITWDGQTTTAYANGTQIGAGETPWEPERWDPHALLLLGNRSDNQRTYLGTYYLLAIHDRCFTPAQVKRHYQAGPAARG